MNLNITEKEILYILKEEYNKRLNYFIKERINIKDKRGENLIKDAVGLKVRDKAGFEYTVGGIVKKGEEEFVKLYLPEFGRDIDNQESSSPLNEFDKNEDDKNDMPQRGFISRRSKVNRDISAGFAGDDYLNNDRKEDIPDVDDEKAVSYSKKKERKYILVPLGEFEERFEV